VSDQLVEVTDINGHRHYLARSAIASISEAGASSAWHGIRAFVKLFDGSVLEVREDARAIARAPS
jgi:hypothetical protein